MSDQARARPMPAVRIGGKKAPRRPVVKKEQKTPGDAEIKNVLSSGGYKVQEVPAVENCSFVGKSGMSISYKNPEVLAILPSEKNVPIGYVIKGKSEVLSSNQAVPTFDLEAAKNLLEKQGVDVEPLIKKLSEGDKGAFEKIVELLRDSKIGEKEDAEEPGALNGDPAEDDGEKCQNPDKKSE